MSFRVFRNQLRDAAPQTPPGALVNIASPRRCKDCVDAYESLQKPIFCGIGNLIGKWPSERESGAYFNPAHASI
ncbi:hypothetical protein PHLCEN_2v10806 [Hermanssonia centrifuga]|uniref:Uncharacterized protein n=1 Tax=Hermanssonia centrifuga TaxID=98765 RepID=A0A2R6NLR5_9APHY|nr:hypothetical protein PHLCEN_2v10806 [Hermanssonia centrifuga]